MNATCLMLTSLIAGADTPAAPVAAPAAPVVVSTGAGCNGCGTVYAHRPVVAHPCNPCGAPATLVDWMKAKAAEPAKPGLFARLRGRGAKPAAAAVAVANPCCDPCATAGVVHHHGTAAPAVAPPVGGGAGVPAEMPKQKDMPKVDPPKVGGTEAPKAAPAKPADPPKAPGAISVPPLPVIPTSGTTGPY